MDRKAPRMVPPQDLDARPASPAPAAEPKTEAAPARSSPGLPGDSSDAALGSPATARDPWRIKNPMPDNPTTPPADGQSGTGPTAIPAARATSNGHVPTLRRFRGDHHCPICGGAEDGRRGRGDRCFGFLSGDGAYAHCTRDECAGGIPCLLYTSDAADE